METYLKLSSWYSSGWQCAMNALQVMDRYPKEVRQVSAQKNDIKVQYVYNKFTFF